jgi:hypothetical protein
MDIIDTMVLQIIIAYLVTFYSISGEKNAVREWLNREVNVKALIGPSLLCF